MHRDGAVADEQGPGDLPVAVAPDEPGQHLGLPAGEVVTPSSRRSGLSRPIRSVRERARPAGPAGQSVGQRLSAEPISRPACHAHCQCPGRLLAPPGPGRGLGLAQPRVRLPVGLACPCHAWATAARYPGCHRPVLAWRARPRPGRRTRPPSGWPSPCLVGDRLGPLGECAGQSDAPVARPGQRGPQRRGQRPGRRRAWPRRPAAGSPLRPVRRRQHGEAVHISPAPRPDHPRTAPARPGRHAAARVILRVLGDFRSASASSAACSVIAPAHRQLQLSSCRYR